MISEAIQFPVKTVMKTEFNGFNSYHGKEFQ